MGSTSTRTTVLNQLQNVLRHPYATEDGRPLPVEYVAAAAVKAAVTPTMEGRLTILQIDDVARTSGFIDLDAVPTPSLLPLLGGMAGTALGAWLLRRWWRS